MARLGGFDARVDIVGTMGRLRVGRPEIRERSAAIALELAPQAADRRDPAELASAVRTRQRFRRHRLRDLDDSRAIGLVRGRAWSQMQDRIARKLAEERQLDPGLVSAGVNAEHAGKPACGSAPDVAAVQPFEETLRARSRGCPGTATFDGAQQAVRSFQSSSRGRRKCVLPILSTPKVPKNFQTVKR
jgi:hypothetical protein